MKRLIGLTLLCLLTAGTLRAAGSDPLDKIAAKIKGYGNFELRFTARSGSGTEADTGRIILAGERYFMDLNGVQIFCDGTTRYTYNRTNEEVLVENAALPEGSSALFYSPKELFSISGKDFAVVTSTRNGAFTRLQLVPLGDKKRYVKELYLTHTDRFDLKRITLQETNGSRIDIDIRAITPNIDVSKVPFRFDATKHPKVEVIDFR